MPSPSLSRAALRGQAIIFFFDSTHSLGCLLKRSAPLDFGLEGKSASIRFRSVNAAIRHRYGVQPYRDFEQLDESLKLSMSSLARDVWAAITKYDVLVWWEYVNTHSNAAGPPSLGDFGRIEEVFA